MGTSPFSSISITSSLEKRRTSISSAWSRCCTIAAKKLGKPIRTFAIGMDTDAIDLKYARQTADYLGSEHHEIIINREMVLSSLEEVIRLLGTWDITTIRASMGMYWHAISN